MGDQAENETEVRSATAAREQAEADYWLVAQHYMSGQCSLEILLDAAYALGLANTDLVVARLKGEMLAGGAPALAGELQPTQSVDSIM